jgi:RNA polymerase sigma-70 factor, ECF subfamily
MGDLALPRPSPAPDPHEPAAPVDAPLVAAARRGDRAAFGALYRRHARLVQAVLLARVAPDSVADLVHDVFLMAMSRLQALRDDAAFAPWIATIARRRAADWRRRRRDTVPLEEAMPEAAATEADPEGAFDAQAAVAAIHSLPEAYRETLMLRFVAGLNGPEIAARTGLTHGSVRVNLHRGVEMLRKKLSEGSGHA